MIEFAIENTPKGPANYICALVSYYIKNQVVLSVMAREISFNGRMFLIVLSSILLNMMS